MDYIERAMDSLTWTGVGFLVTAAILLLTIRLKGGEKGPSEMTWLDALLVGVAQMFAPLPGVSRSGLTISAALALGFSKTWAVEFQPDDGRAGDPGRDRIGAARTSTSRA